MTLLWRQLLHPIILVVVLVLSETTQPVHVVVQFGAESNVEKLFVFLVFKKLVSSVLNGDVTVLMLLLVVAFQLTLFAAQYCSFKDVFGAGGPEPGPEGPDDQLVA